MLGFPLEIDRRDLEWYIEESPKQERRCDMVQSTKPKYEAILRILRAYVRCWWGEEERNKYMLEDVDAILEPLCRLRPKLSDEDIKIVSGKLRGYETLLPTRLLQRLEGVAELIEHGEPWSRRPWK
jgi:hypothetical protein